MDWRLTKTVPTFTFLLIESEALNGRPVVFAPDEATAGERVNLGAERGVIYTRAELAELKLRGVTTEALPAVHEAKEQFSGKVAAYT